MKRILITGASGLLGSHTLHALHRTHNITAMVRQLPAHPLENVRYIAADFIEGFDSAELPVNIDAIFHLAQSPHMREYPEKAREIRAVNAESTAHLLTYAKKAGAERFIFASTGGLYRPSPTAFTESSPLHIAEGALSYYFATKHESEQMLAAYAGDFATIILRPFFMYGEGQAPNMLIPRLIHNVRSGIPLTLQGVHGMLFNPLHVSDAVLALAATLSLSTHHIFNFAGSDIITMRQAGEIIGEAFGITPRFTFGDDVYSSMVASNALMCEHLSCPALSFKDGIMRMLHTAREAAHV